MNFPSTNQSDASNLEFEVTVDEAIEPASASPAKPATAVLVIIPRGIKFKVDMESHPWRDVRADPGRRGDVTAKTRRRHSAEFRANAVRKLNEPGQSAQAIADELEVRPSLLYRWRHCLITDGAYEEQGNGELRFLARHRRRRSA